MKTATKKKSLPQITHEAFDAIDAALSKIKELEAAYKDPAWKIAEHLKTQSISKDTRRTLIAALDLAGPNHETKRLSFGGALYHASDDTVLDLLQFLNQVEKIEDPKSDHPIVMQMVSQERRKLQHVVMDQLAERVQLYRHDITDQEAN